MVEGWRSVEELIGWGFAHAPVVMANEAHNGLARCIRTREVGVRMIRAAHEAGVWRLAMEALPWPAPDTPGPIMAIPPVPGGYLAQPDVRRLISAALELGWSLWAYEAEPAAGTARPRCSPWSSPTGANASRPGKGIFTGTRHGALHSPAGDIPPAGHRVTVPYIQLLRFRNGQHISFNLIYDRLLMLEQLGLTQPRPPRAEHWARNVLPEPDRAQP